MTSPKQVGAKPAEDAASKKESKEVRAKKLKRLALKGKAGSLYVAT